MVGEIDLLEREALTQRGELGQPRMLQRDILVRVEVVETDDVVAALEQQLRRV